MRRISKKWMLYRLRHVLGRQADGSFADTITTAQVQNALKLSTPVLRRWIADPYFQKARVAIKAGAFWQWNREQTILWVIAVLRIDCSGSLEDARELIGVPLDYCPRKGERFTEIASMPHVVFREATN